jgi:hypothetical protein
VGKRRGRSKGKIGRRDTPHWGNGTTGIFALAAYPKVYSSSLRHLAMYDAYRPIIRDALSKNMWPASEMSPREFVRKPTNTSTNIKATCTPTHPHTDRGCRRAQPVKQRRHACTVQAKPCAAPHQRTLITRNRKILRELLSSITWRMICLSGMRVGGRGMRVGGKGNGGGG